jgi:hypothetical protein
LAVISSNTASSYGSATGRGTRQRPPPPLPLEQQTPSAPRPHLHTENISGQRGPITSVFALEDFAGDEQVSAAPIVEGRTKITGPIIEQSHSWFCGKTEELQQEVSVLETQLAELEQNNLRSPVLLQKLGEYFGFGAAGKLGWARFKLNFKQEQLDRFEAQLEMLKKVTAKQYDTAPEPPLYQ